MMETHNQDILLIFAHLYFFSSFLMFFKNSLRNFNEDPSHLIYAFFFFVATSGSVAGPGVGMLSKYFVGNNLRLKLLRTFSLALNNNPTLFKKYFFSSAFISLSKFFNSLAKLLCLLSSFSKITLPIISFLYSYISEKTIGSKYLLEL